MHMHVLILAAALSAAAPAAGQGAPPQGPGSHWVLRDGAIVRAHGAADPTVRARPECNLTGLCPPGATRPRSPPCRPRAGCPPDIRLPVPARPPASAGSPRPAPPVPLPASGMLVVGAVLLLPLVASRRPRPRTPGN